MRAFLRKRIRILMAAVSVAVLAGCQVLTSPSSQNAVVITGWSFIGCAAATDTLPGQHDCTAELYVYVSLVDTSGYVSASVAYPDQNSYYTGEVQVAPNLPPGDLALFLTNPYVAKCVSSYPTHINLYDGSLTGGGARLLKSVAFTLRHGC